MSTTTTIRRPVYCTLPESDYVSEEAAAILDREVDSVKGRDSGVRVIRYGNGGGWVRAGKTLHPAIGGVASGTLVRFADDCRDLGVTMPASGITLARDEDGWRVTECGDVRPADAALAFESALVRTFAKSAGRAVASDLYDGQNPNPAHVDLALRLGRHYSAVIGWGTGRLSGR